MFAKPRIRKTINRDGSILLSSEEALEAHPASITASFRTNAEDHPERVLAAERSGSGWEGITWGEARQKADAIAGSLLDLGLGPERPLMVLSGNSVAHLVLMLGAHTAGVPIAPISPAYSLMSEDHARLIALARQFRPGLIVTAEQESFAPALANLQNAGVDASVVAGTEAIEGLAARAPGEEVERAAAAQGRDTVAKVLFTSGSTGAPKGVITTHGMLTSNQQALAQIWPFLRTTPPVLVDWLPWSHTFGGNHNLNQILTFGGTLYIDDGRPTPADFHRTIEALRSVQPTAYYNVPIAYSMLVQELEQDREFATELFETTRFLFYAAAALPPSVWDRLEKLIAEVAEHPVPLTASWGTTETAPLATSAHYEGAECGCIGVPVPGVTLKLVPESGKTEIRVSGPNVTQGYLENAAATEVAFDGDGFYRTGDAVRMIDPDEPSRGLTFDGRISEDFKLTTGTWVSVGKLRTSLLSTCGILKDAVITGQDRAYVGAIAWLDEASMEAALGADPAVAKDPVALGDFLGRKLAEHNAGGGSSMRVERLLLLDEPPSIDAGEITDKGYVNQRRVLDRRAELVSRLYGEPADFPVILARA